MAKVRKRSGPTCPSLTAYTKGNDSPANNTSHQRTDRETGRTATPTMNAATSSAIQAYVAVVADRSPKTRTSGANVGG